VATGVRAQCLGMMNVPDLASARSDPPAPLTDRLQLAVAAHMARFAGPLLRAPRPLLPDEAALT